MLFEEFISPFAVAEVNPMHVTPSVRSFATTMAATSKASALIRQRPGGSACLNFSQAMALLPLPTIPQQALCT